MDDIEGSKQSAKTKPTLSQQTISNNNNENDDGPTWWNTYCLPVETADLDDVDIDAEECQIFVLFEYFGKNAEKYAFLRVSCSDGADAYQRTFSNDSIFPTGKTLLDAVEPCAGEGKGEGRDSHSVTQVLKVPKVGPPPVVRVKCDAFSRPVNICITQPISQSDFINRITVYFTYVQRQLRHAQQDLQHQKEVHREKAQKFEAAVDEKIRSDRMLRHGTAVLMREKLKWRDHQDN